MSLCPAAIGQIPNRRLGRGAPQFSLKAYLCFLQSEHAEREPCRVKGGKGLRMHESEGETAIRGGFAQLMPNMFGNAGLSFDAAPALKGRSAKAWFLLCL